MRGLCSLLLLLAGCGAGLRGELSSADGGLQAFDASGAVIAWVDQVDASLTTRELPILKLLLTGLSFDASEDLLARSGSELADLQLRFATSDAVGFSLIDARRRGEAEELKLTTAPNGASCPQLNGPAIEDLACLRVAPSPLEADSGFESIRPLARGAEMILKLEAGARELGQVLRGEITITVTAVDGDDEASALTGTLSGAFETALLGERLAERNLGLLQGTGL